MLHPQVRPQRVDATVRGRTVGADGSLGSVRVEVVPAIGDLLAARPATPHGARQLPRRREHVVVGHLVVMVVVVMRRSSCSRCRRRHCQDIGGGRGTARAARTAHGIGAHQRQVVVVVVEGTGPAAAGSEHGR